MYMKACPNISQFLLSSNYKWHFDTSKPELEKNSIHLLTFINEPDATGEDNLVKNEQL